jgi:putative toxin-antitoxin system antitoxin component (TIGR02293 family)
MATTNARGATSRRLSPTQAVRSGAASKGQVAQLGARAAHGRVKVAQSSSVSVWTKNNELARLEKEDFVSLFNKDPLEHVGLVKHGVPALLVELVAGGMGVSKEKLLITLGLPRATIQRKAKTNQSLTPEESSRVLGISRLIGQTQAMVEASGDPSGFDAATWVAQWLDQPLPALGGKRPAELMDTAEGQAIVSNMLSRAQSGAYA